MAPLLRGLLILALLLPTLGLAADGDVLPVPDLQSPVTDQAGLLTASQQQALVSKIEAFEQQKGSQIAVLIVPTTQPEDIFSYSFRVADHWKLGRKGVDDGVLFVIATQDKKTNLQIGYGLEGAIPDITSKQILQDIVRPYFQQGDFNGGINAGVDALIKAANGEPLPAPQRHAQAQGGGFVPALIAGVFAAVILQFLLGRALGGAAGGFIGGGVATVLGISLAGSVGVGVLVAILIWLGFFRGGFGGPYIGGGGFGGGGFGGGGSFGGGGGGWSGGGGGFGGGGASGNW